MAWEHPIAPIGSTAGRDELVVQVDKHGINEPLEETRARKKTNDALPSPRRV